MSDLINSPAHYMGAYGLEALDVIENFVDGLEGLQAYYQGNVIKYVLRWPKKGGLQDLKKARVYLDKLIEDMELAEDIEREDALNGNCTAVRIERKDGTHEVD